MFSNVIGDQFENSQNIVQNSLTDGQEFGKAVAIDTTGTTVSIGALQTAFTEIPTFDEGDTNYDSSSTLFIDDTQRGGNVFAYPRNRWQLCTNAKN